jgi:hypothetical protein
MEDGGLIVESRINGVGGFSQFSIKIFITPNLASQGDDCPFKKGQIVETMINYI